MKTIELKDELYERYGITMEPQDYERLTHTMDMFNVGRVNFHIEIQSDLNTFINNIYTSNDLNFSRVKSKFELEEVIYAMKPIIHGSYLNAKINYPKIADINRARIPKAEWYNKDEKNMVLIHRILLEVSNDRITDEEFVLVIYNPEIETRAGIIFQSL